MNVFDKAAMQNTEACLAWRCCLCSPFIGIAGWFIAAKALLTFLYLKPIASNASLLPTLQWKPALAIGLIGFVLPWAWLAGIDIERRLPKRIPWAATLALLLVVTVSIALTHPRVNWFFVEWAILRTPNPSFARNTLFWQQSDFERTGEANSLLLPVRLVGSSQIYQGTDAALLVKECPLITVEKRCLAGFGPMQYPWLQDRILTPKPRLLVCWLSEFDFFREDDLPVNRLRWASTLDGCRRLESAVDLPTVAISERWESISHGENWHPHYRDDWSMRGGYADLLMAAVNPLWRVRDHVRRVVFGYWWDVSRSSVESTEDGPQLAQSSEMSEARESLRMNVGQKRMVETNFRSFRMFAEELQLRGISLLVLEGSSHPEATAVNPSEFRVETRQRLRAMSQEVQFNYREENAMPRFQSGDFADAYHLNTAGRQRLSEFLGPLICENVQAVPDHSTNEKPSTP